MRLGGRGSLLIIRCLGFLLNLSLLNFGCGNFNRRPRTDTIDC